MESSPSKVDETSEISDKKESKKKKKAGKLGTVALHPESKVREPGKTDEPESFWQKLAKPESSTKDDKKTGESAELRGEAESLEEISPVEKQFIEKELVRAANSEAEVLAIEAAIQEFRDRIISGEDSEEAYEATLESLDTAATPAEEAPDATEIAVEDAPEKPVDEPILHEFSDDEEISFNTPLGRGEEDKSQDGSTAPVSTAGAGRGGSGSGGSSGGGRPPAPPRGPRGGHGGGFNNFPGVVAPGVRANTVASTPPQAAEYDPGNPAAAALLGGIIGYLIGRRRGRIKSERKLLPIQKKLQKEVVDLQWGLKAKEASLRQAARDKSYLRQQLTLERSQLQPAAISVAERAVAPEARAMHGKALSQERIGHVLVTAEAATLPVAKAKESAEIKKAEEIKRQKVEAPVVTKHVEHLSRAELMAISDKIIVEGSSLRQIYENRLVGEKGLRRLVAEHLRGGNVKKTLRREIMEREIDFERDPVMRDHPTVALSKGNGRAETPALQRLLERADAALPAHDEEVAYYKARAEYEAKEKQHEQKQQHILDASLGVTIVVLITIILMLVIDKF